MKIILLLLFLFSNSIFAQQISTYMGVGTYGSAGDGGLAESAQSYLPNGLSFDNFGNLLVCQRISVRKVDKTTMLVTTIAGSDTASSLGGWGDGRQAITARVVSAYDVATDKEGNFYIADYWTQTIRKVDIITGIIDLYTGTTASPGSSGDGGIATAAKIGVGSIEIDTMRNYLYNFGGFERKVRRIDMSTNIIETFAGTGIDGYEGDGGPATAAKFGRIMGGAIDNAGNVYIGDWDNHRIRKVDIASGVVTTIAGNGMDGYGGDGGPATAAMLKKPIAMCFDKCGNLYFSDEENNRVRRIDATTGIISTVAGTGIAGFSGDGGPALLAEFNHPTGVCIDGNFNMYVGDYYNHRVRKISLGNCDATGVGVNDPIKLFSAITIYPNPVQDELSVSSEEPIEEVTLYNAVGQLVVHGAGGGQRSVRLSVGQLPAGVYMVRVNGQYVNRVVKQ